MIKTLTGAVAEAIAAGKRPKGFPPELVKRAQNKLAMIDAAGQLSDLASPPGNRLEALKGDRRGQHSIRVNDQWRVCFTWEKDGARNVEIVDYHD